MATGPWGGLLNQRVFRAKILMRHGGQQIQTGFHLRDVGINTLSPEDVANEVAEFATGTFRQWLHPSTQIVGIDVENLVSREGHSISPSDVFGALNQTPAPSHLMVSVALKSSQRKRSANGRMFWPIGCSTSFSGNEILPGLATLMEAAIDDLESRFIGPSITTSMHLVHLHKDIKDAGGVVTTPAAWYDITSLRLSWLVRSIKSRQAGHGN